MTLKIVSNPLVTVDQVRDKAGQTDNAEITDEQIEQIQSQVTGLVMSHVASRYDISKFSDDIFENSMTHNLLKSISVELGSAILTLKYYGIQKLTEDNNAQKSYEMQMTMLTDIRDGQLRLLDNTFNEFPLLPLKANRSLPGEIVSSFNDTSIIPNTKTFKVDKIR